MINRAHVLYQDDEHVCLQFSDLVKGEGIQSNQFLIIDNQRAALIDPGGDLTFAALSVEVEKFASIENLDYIFASHQDPDIIASLPKWLMKSKTKIITSKLWSRFLPHLVPGYMSGVGGLNLEERVVGLPDFGGEIRLGESKVVVVPAHFLHSVGNFQFFDVKSRILFSGDMGASLLDGQAAAKPVEDFQAHVSSMTGFHQRYMTSNIACRHWAAAVRKLNPRMLVPQHGAFFQGQQIEEFLVWIENLKCGVDLIDESFYLPRVSQFDTAVA